MKLYSKTDLERCARLAVQNSQDGQRIDRIDYRLTPQSVEEAVFDAVEMIVQEIPEVYRREQVEIAATEAATLVLSGVTIAEAAERAVQRLQSR